MIPRFRFALFLGACLLLSPPDARGADEPPTQVKSEQVKSEKPPAAPRTGMPKVLSAAPTDVVRGSPVTVSGEFLDSKVEEIAIRLGGVDLGHPSYVAGDGKSFVFVLPEAVTREDKKVLVPLGTQLLRVTITGGPPDVSGMTSVPYTAGYLRVLSDGRTPPRLLKVAPAAAGAGTKRLVLVGESLTGPPEDYALLRDGQDLRVCWTENCSGLRGRLISPYELELTGSFDSSWVGTHELSLRAGDVTTPSPVKVVFAAYSSEQIRHWAVGVGLGILALMVVIARRGGAHKIGGTAYVWRAFLIDTETDTYSLSKLQFYMWSAAALFGYCYLSLSRSLAQGSFELPEVPTGLPGILAVSAGTAVASVGITGMRGPKAAGAAQPSFGDLINTGGVVSPERFQFLLWTMVAIAAFLFSALRMDPSSITELPKVPESLLVLSGVSSAGYLGGKLVRAPGPIIDEILVSIGSLDLTVLGRNLGVDASFEVNGKSITSLLATTQGRHQPEVLAREDGERSKDYAKSMKLRLLEPDPDWRESADAPPRPPALELTIVNRDGQRASCPITLDLTKWRKFAPATEAGPGGTPKNT